MNARELKIHRSLVIIYDTYKHGSDLAISYMCRRNGIHTNYAKILKDKGLLIKNLDGTQTWIGDRPTELFSVTMMDIHSKYSAGYQKKIQSGYKSELMEISRKLDLILNHLNIDDEI